MQYILVQNKQTLLLGPMDWRPRFFQSEINDLVDNGDLTTDWIAPPVEPGYVNLGNGFEIFLVLETSKPDFDNDFSQLAGPYFTYDSEGAYESYSIIDHSIDTVKNNLKDLAGKVRQHKENVTDTIAKISVQNKTVSVDVKKDVHTLIHKHYAMNDFATPVKVKFNEGWMQLTKQDLSKIISETNLHVQKHADWEYNIHNKIDATSTIVDLKKLKLEEIILNPFKKTGV